MGTVKYLDMKSKPLCSAIYVKFDHPKAGNSLTDGRLHNQLNECVPIPARIKTFLLNKCISTVIAEKKTASVNTWPCNYCPSLKEVLWLISKAT